MRFLSHSPAETFSLAKALAPDFARRSPLALTGPLGAGKTHFVKGLAAGLGLKKVVTSPTFVIMKNYPLPRHYGHSSLRRSLIHIDCYRLSSPLELADLGFGELLADRKNLLVIEWADKIRELLPAAALWIDFTHLSSMERLIVFKNFSSKKYSGSVPS